MTDEQSCFCSRRACCQLVTEDDLKVLVNFLREFSYLYESPNIRFLADKQWQRPPVEVMALLQSFGHQMSSLDTNFNYCKINLIFSNLLMPFQKYDHAGVEILQFSS